MKTSFKNIIIITNTEKDVEKINIAICDNNSIVLSDIAKMLEDFSEKGSIDVSYSCFNEYEQLLDKISDFDFFILDYNMADNDDGSDSEEKINGMEFARRIRQRSDRKGIVFITAYPEFVYESFEVRTYRFLVKPVIKEKLFDAIQSFINNTTESGKILISFNKELYPVNIDDILYFEVSGKNTFIYSENNVLKCRKPITTFEEELKEFNFCRIHRSYIVNINKIKQFDTRTVTLINGEKIFISQKCYPKLCELYLQNKSKTV